MSYLKICLGIIGKISFFDAIGGNIPDLASVA